MIRNYIRIALRGIMQNKALSFISMIGLCIGVACCLVLAVRIQDEMSYDQHHKDLDNLYRMTMQYKKTETIDGLNKSVTLVTCDRKNQLHEINKIIQLVNAASASEDLEVSEESEFYKTDNATDARAVDVFSEAFEGGNPKKAL
jgi:putative ABC transport system permease protein